MGEYGASCFHTLSDESRDIEKAQWDQERFGQVCTSPATIAEWKAAILKMCKETKRCDFETKVAIHNFIDRLEKKVINRSMQISGENK